MVRCNIINDVPGITRYNDEQLIASWRIYGCRTPTLSPAPSEGEKKGKEKKRTVASGNAVDRKHDRWRCGLQRHGTLEEKRSEFVHGHRAIRWVSCVHTAAAT